MMRTLTIATLMLMGIASTALAQPSGPPERRPAPASADFDERGWVLLGEQTVSGNVDKDKIIVGRDDGQFSKLTLRVLESDLELIDFRITFGDRTTYDPKIKQFFREGARTKAIDLPRSAVVIKQIDFKYKNIPGGGRAKLQVWGWRTGDNPGGRPPVGQPPPQSNWDARGWTKLGERDVDGRVDRDRIEVARYEGKFSKMTIVVRDSDLEMQDFAVKFARGPEWRPTLSHYFRENQRTRVIDFPGDERVIQYIEFKYRNLPGGGRAKVEVWAWKTDGASNAPTTGPVEPWNPNGWQMLGEKNVNRRRPDKDKFNVGRDQGTFNKLTIVVLDSDLQLRGFKVKFARGPGLARRVDNQVVREGARTHVIDLPGDRRVIKSIELMYKNLPGGGNAKVQVWGR